MKIDFVIAWVDGSDPAWLKEKAEYSPSPETDDNEVRYRDWNLLRFWFRGVERYASWVHTIYFVTWGHIPEWLNTKNPKLKVITHKEFIPAEYLPTFNSHTIELNLHRIPDISEHFVYFNDDMFIVKPVKETDFFNHNLPCDTFALDAIYFGPDSAGPYNGNDLIVINKNFKKKTQFKKFAFSKFLKFRYGIPNMYRTMVLSFWPWFTGFRYYHIHSNFLKSTFEEVWDEEFEIMDCTCRDKFRSITNVNQWLMKYWQLCNGNFYPQRKNFGRAYHLKEFPCEAFIDDYKKHRYSVVCLNETAKTEDWMKHKELLCQIFNTEMQKKSSFEKE